MPPTCADHRTGRRWSPSFRAGGAEYAGGNRPTGGPAMGEAAASLHEQPPMARSALPAELASESSAELSEDDPFTAYLLAAAGPVDIRRLDLESPALKALKEAGAVLVVPMISAGVTVGMLALGPR